MTDHEVAMAISALDSLGRRSISLVVKSMRCILVAKFKQKP